MSVVKTEPNVNNCPECGSNLKTDSGEAYCEECGLVVEENLANRRTKFNGGSDSITEARNSSGVGTGAESNVLHDKNLGSQISFKNKDAKGRQIKSKKRQQLNRIRRWQRVYQFDSHDSRARKAISEMLRYADTMDIGEETIQIAGQLFRQAHETDIAVGRTMDGLADAVLYLAAKQTNQTREWDEWVENANTTESILRIMVSDIKQELNLGFLPDRPTDYAPQILDEMYVPGESRKEVFQLLSEVEEELPHIGRKPQGIVAACIYLASEYSTQREVAEAANTTPHTVRKNLKDMEDMDATTGYEYYE